jgi:hypothetical protein
VKLFEELNWQECINTQWKQVNFRGVWIYTHNMHFTNVWGKAGLYHIMKNGREQPQSVSKKDMYMDLDELHARAIVQHILNERNVTTEVTDDQAA